VCVQFGGEQEEKVRQAVGTFCSNQPLALEIIKTRQKKEQRFNAFIQVTVYTSSTTSFTYLKHMR
jgi:hypothetical protein